MRFYCVELKWSFDSARMAYTLEGLGLTIVDRDYRLVGVF